LGEIDIFSNINFGRADVGNEAQRLVYEK